MDARITGVLENLIRVARIKQPNPEPNPLNWLGRIVGFK